MHQRTLGLIASFVLTTAVAVAWTSSKVQYDVNGRLYYPADSAGNRIPDFSHAGYAGGGAPLPSSVPVRITVSPVDGDDTAAIQAAIDAVGAMPIQSDGYRGTVLLTAGVFDLAGTVKLNRSGVVLAGSGDGTDPTSATILRRSGTSQANVITAGSGSDDQFKTEIAGSRRPIVTPRVTVGSFTVTVDDASGFTIGDNVIVYHPSTAAWIAAMDNGGVTDSNTWKPGEIDIRYSRYITAVSGNTLALDAPVFNHLDRGLAQSQVYKYNRVNVVTHVGIEDLFIDIETAGPTSEDHAENAVEFRGAEDSWIRDCSMQHFWHAGVQFVTSTRCTAERVRAIDPHSIITGERRYNFSTYHAQLILFRDCFARDARHAFVTNGTSLDSGNVWLNCIDDHNLTYAEAHRRWSTGLLFDGVKATNRGSGDVFGFYNRGNYGTGHGWAAGHSVVWGADAAGGKVLVQQPPTAQNYAIGCFGNVTGSGPWAGPVGFREGSNTAGLQPQSLYLEQLAQRQSGAPAPDLTAPSAPSGLNVTGVTASNATLSWEAASDDVAVDGYDIFAGNTYLGSTSTATSLTLTGLTGGTTYAFSVRARDAYGNQSAASNVVSVTTPGSTSTLPPVVLESENLAFTPSGANASIANETTPSPSNSQIFASNFKYVSLGADGNPAPPNGEFIDFTLPNIPAGTYNLVMRYKVHPNRGIMRLFVDGVVLGPDLDQRATQATFTQKDFGVLRFATAGNHVVRLAVVGKNSASTAFTITSDVFTLNPDGTAPVINGVADKTAEAAGPDGAVVAFTATATDNKDGNVPVSFNPPSGSLFPVGPTLVVATAEDFAGNIGTATFKVVVRDTTPPSLTLPDDLVLEATGPAGATASFAASANDLVSGIVDVGYSQSSGTVFPLGTTAVTATATDDFDNVATGAFNVTVQDTTPPALSLPGAIVAEASSTAGASVSFAVAADDLVSGSVAVAVSHPSGTTFPLGTTTVNATAMDAAGNSVSGAFTVTVLDRTAPVIESVSASPSVIWPPNKKMVPVTFTAVANDALGIASVKIKSFSCNEASMIPTVAITGPLAAKVMADRNGNGTGRIYTFVIEAKDAAGNASTRTVTVSVPHDNGN